MNEASRVHIEKIAKFYSQVIVHVTTNADWACQYIHPNAVVGMRGGCFKDLNKDMLAKWKDIRVVAIDEKVFTLPNYLVYFPHLIYITCQDCTRQMATAIFDYAASSTTLRTLEVEACEDFTDGYSPITSTMADNLYKWIASQPIESITIKYFVWEVYSQRHAVVSSALAKFSLKKLEMDEKYASGWCFVGNYDRAKKVLQLEVFDPRNYGFENLDLLIDYIGSLEPLLDTDITDLELFDFVSEGFGDLWPLFVPMVQRLQLEKLTVYIDNVTVADAVKVVESLQNASTLESLSIVKLWTKLPMDVVLTLLHRVSSSVKRLPVVCEMTLIAEPYSREDSMILQDLARKRGIDLLL
ncbi:unnamed protein product [Aphanomyces euteiches]